MIRRRTLLSTAFAATAAIGLAACSDDAESGGNGSSDGGGDAAPALDTVTVSEDLGAEPTIDFTPPVAITAPDAKVIVAGDGDPIAEGDMVVWRSAFADASTGEILQSWWQGAPAGGLLVTADRAGEEAFSFLTSVTVGSRFAMAGWQSDQSGNALSLIQVSDVDRVISPLHAEGEAQEPSGTFPTVTLAEDGAPTLDAPPEGEPPTTTTREELILGAGDTTRAGDFLTMHYTGWKWSDGSQFDSSWERGAPFSFVQGTEGPGGVITGWDQNLLDVPVGSQVLLVVPPTDGYGEDPEAHELGGETLVFVIDVLDAAHTVE